MGAQSRLTPARMKFLLTVFVCVASTSAVSLLNTQWNKFKADHKKVYSTSAEEVPRKEIFAQNLAKIEEHNRRGLSWTEGVNKFSDLTKEEFTSLYASGRTSTRGPRVPVDYQDMKERVSELPAEVDWRTEGAFAASSVMASYAAINNKSHELLEISPQHLVSCVPNPLQCGGSGGCQGSIEPLAYTYASLFGVATEDDYPYVSGNGQNDDHCDFDAATTDAAVMTMGFETLPRNDAAALMEHLATKGPLSASVAASSWPSYSGGVFDGCNYEGNMVVNHAVMLVGYGTDETLGDYWLIKNSWDSDWGEEGYIRLRRQETPQCAIDSSPLDGSGCVYGGVESVEVCGTCAVVSDNSYPIGTTFMY